MQERLSYLFQKFFDQVSSAEETDELLDLVHQSIYDEELNSLLESAWQNFNPTEKIFNDTQKAEMLDHILGKPVVNIRRSTSTRWFKWAAAAAIFIVLATGGYFLFNRDSKKDLAKTSTQGEQDVKPPATAKAMITLSNGKK